MNPDLEDLLAAWLTGEIDPAREEALLARLRTDDEFRREFAQELHMLGMLKAVQSTEPRWLRLEEELRGSENSAEGGEATSMETRVMDALDQLPWYLSIRPWKKLALAGLAVAVLTALSFWMLWKPAAPLAVEPTPTESSLAVAVKVDEVVWDPAQEGIVAEGQIVGPGWLHLRSGRLYLAFLNGVRLHIQGPADVHLISIGQVFCTQGKLAVHVPPASEVRDFTISAPGAAVVDMGTEFGFNVVRDQGAKLMVFRGAAEASVLAANGTTLRSEVLKQNVTAEIRPDLGQVRKVALARAEFLEAPNIEMPALALADAYAQAVQESQPWGYWRFESFAGGAVINEVAGGPALRAKGPLSIVPESGSNSSVRFQPGDNSQFLQMEGHWSPPADGEYAIEFLFASEQYKDSSMIALITDAEAHFTMVELTAREPEHLVHKPGTLRYLHRQPPATFGGVNLFSSTIFFPYHWHHIVAQRVGDRVEMYIDGELAGDAQVSRPDLIPACNVLLGRLRQNPVPAGDTRTFVGHLDEVAIYPHPLSSSEIRRHAALAHVTIKGKPLD